LRNFCTLSDFNEENEMFLMDLSMRGHIPVYHISIYGVKIKEN